MGPADAVPRTPATSTPATSTPAASTPAATTVAGGTTTARAADADWAATSTVLAALGARASAWRRAWTRQRTAKLLTSMTAFLVVVVCGLGWGATSWLEAAVRQIGALDPDSSAIRDAAAQAGDQNFLVVGSDTRVGTAPIEDAGDSSDVPGARADTVMVVHIPEDRSRVTVVSFPRDLEISRPECERWDPVSGTYDPRAIIPRTPQVKLNSAYAAGGPRCVTKAVQEISGLAINRFLGVDFQGFKGMVDAVQGVPVCVERPVRDSVLGVIVPRAGTSVLTGDQALNFVRARHVQDDPSSDYGRIERQQRFLSSLLRTVLSAGTLLDPGKLRGLVDAVARSTFGENIGTEQLLSLSQSLNGLDPSQVTFTTVPTTGQANARGNEVLRTPDARALFSSIIDNRPLPGQAPPPGPAPAVAASAPASAPAAPATPQQVSVRMLDGRSSGDDGSSSVSEELRAYGFTVVPDDRSASEETTTIRFSPDRATAAATLARAVPSATLEPGAPGSGTLTLTLGEDFDDRIESPAPAAPPAPTISAADTTCS